MTAIFDRLQEFEKVSTLTLATTSADGQPHAAPVYFASMQVNQPPIWRLYFFSDPHSRHARDLAHSPLAAAALYPECLGWQDIRGLQLRGMVHKVEAGPEWEQAWGAYRAKFPFVSQLKAVVARNALYSLTPTWIRLVDNRRRFGYKKEWNIEIPE